MLGASSKLAFRYQFSYFFTDQNMVYNDIMRMLGHLLHDLNNDPENPEHFLSTYKTVSYMKFRFNNAWLGLYCTVKSRFIVARLHGERG